MLKGTYSPPEEVDPSKRYLMQALSRPSDLSDTLRHVISTDTFKQGWSNTKERKSAVFSGVHFGHVKAYFSSP